MHVIYQITKQKAKFKVNRVCALDNSYLYEVQEVNGGGGSLSKITYVTNGTKEALNTYKLLFTMEVGF